MTRPLPPIHLLSAFLAAVQLGSFTAAAEDQGITQSGISRRVAELERLLGITLFRRVGRRVVPTPQARRLATELEGDLARLSEALRRSIASNQDTSILRVSSLPTFAERWLLPRLSIFEAKHKGLRVDLGTRSAPFSFATEPFDLAIHYGKAHWPDANITHLCDEQMIPVATPAIAANLDLSDLDNAVLLHLESRPWAWADWTSHAQLPSDGAWKGRHMDTFSLIIRAALSGMGAALLPRYLIEAELQRGDLVVLSDVLLKTDASYHVVLPSGAANPDAAAFSTWVRAQVGTPIHDSGASIDPA